MERIFKKFNSKLQLSSLNNRIYVMDLDPGQVDSLIPYLDEQCSQHGYTKIFAKVPENSQGAFENAGYRLEAFIPEFYQSREAVLMVGKYFSETRKNQVNPEKVQKILALAQKTPPVKKIPDLPPGFVSDITAFEDAEKLAGLYGQVFETYPFMIDDPDYLKQTMAKNVKYFIIRKDQKIVASASAEMDQANQNVEMTDFATLPDYRGKKLAQHLLFSLEKEMRKLNFKVAYTIARSVSAGMNITFAKLGYKYSGTLINNTHIAGQLEDMNVWFKTLK